MSLEESRIIPDVVDRVSPASGAQLEVAFGGKPISPGQAIRPADAVSPPHIAVRGGSEGGLFTVVASDPDPPDPAAPKFREWLHGIWTNVPASSDVTKGNEVQSWLPPTPPIGTHRYVFMLYQQPNQEPVQAAAPAERRLFSTRKFAAQHGLGDPVAVTWFNSHK